MRRLVECSADSEVRAATLCPAHRELAVAYANGDICILDVAAGCVREKYAIPDGWITALQFGADSRGLIVGALERGGWWIDRVRKQLKPLQAPMRHIPAAAVSSCGQWVAFAGDGGLRVGRASPRVRLIQRPLREVPNPNSVAFSPDAKLIAVGGGEGANERAYLGLVDAGSLTLRWLMDLGEDMLCIDTVSFSPDGERLLAGGYKECAIIRLGDTPEVETTLSIRSWCSAAAFYPDGDGIVVGDEIGYVNVFRPLRRATRHSQVGDTVLHISPCAKDSVDIVIAERHTESQRWTIQVVRATSDDLPSENSNL